MHLYDVREINNSSLSANILQSVKNLKEESTDIINNIEENLNPNVKNDKQTTDDIIKERLSGIIKTCKPKTKQDLEILKGLEDILSSK